MQPINLLTASLFLLLLPTTILTQSTNWTDSCLEATIEGTVLTATCFFGDGVWRQTQLDLDYCFMNVNGDIACAEDGNFGASCQNCDAIGGPKRPLDSYMSCKCWRIDGSLNLGAHIDTNTCLGNNENGQLVCGSIIGN